MEAGPGLAKLFFATAYRVYFRINNIWLIFVNGKLLKSSMLQSCCMIRTELYMV